MSDEKDESRPAKAALVDDLKGSIGARPDGSRRYGGSLWNAWLDVKLAADLTIEEHKLADALARNVIGFGGRTSERLGNVLLRSEARLHGRSFERARDGLAAKGLVRFEKGRGRGARTLYVLAIVESEKAAEARPYSEDVPAAEKAAEARSYSGVKAAEKTADKAAQERSRIKDNGKEERALALSSDSLRDGDAVAPDGRSGSIVDTKGDDVLYTAATLRKLSPLARALADRRLKEAGGQEVVSECVRRAEDGISFDEDRFCELLDSDEVFKVFYERDFPDGHVEYRRSYRDAVALAESKKAEGCDVAITAAVGSEARAYFEGS